ncbi:MAG: AraC family transcriptional regulator, partial [Acidobacteriaceae bacterium]|nr:AraC family transcriptional regulator [Acidobacteriaceae bacterium]
MNSVLGHPALIDSVPLDPAQLDPVPLDPDVCYRALQTRDGRFDGRFFTAVTSTGIYCRPICPARTPMRKHC